MTPAIFCFDVESNGLHGEGFAAAAVRLEPDGAVSFRWRARTHAPRPCEPWVAAHVLPKLPTRVDYTSVRELRSEFWRVFEEHARGALLVVDCGWPVEARWLAACVDDAPKRSERAPYPLHELATLLLAAGLDPTGNHRDLLPAGLVIEGAPHDPLYDAELSARLARHALVLLDARAATPG